MTFPDTPHEMVDAAQAGSRDALGKFFLLYREPLTAHLKHRMRLSADQAEDVVQSFLADKVIERRLLEAWRREQGKFRTFLCTALDRFAVDQWRRRDRAQPSSDGELDLSAEPAPADSDRFSRACAVRLVREAADRMTAECEKKGRADFLRIAQECWFRPLFEGTEPASDGVLMDALPRIRSVEQLGNLRINARRMFFRNLRAAAAECAADPEQIEAEIAGLPALLAQAFRHGSEDDPAPAFTGVRSTRPRLLQELLTEPPRREPTDAELSAAWSETLAGPVADAVGVEIGLPAQFTLAQLLADPKPAVAALRAVKDWAKRAAEDGDDPAVPVALQVLYYACIAAAHLRLRESITKHDGAALRQLVLWSLERSWLDAATRSLFAAALETMR